MIKEFIFDEVSFKMQILSNVTYKEFLKQKGIAINELENDKRIALGFEANVLCDVYTYTNPTTNVLQYIYEYIEKIVGENEFGSYVVATESNKEIDVFKLYDVMSKFLDC